VLHSSFHQNEPEWVQAVSQKICDRTGDGSQITQLLDLYF